MLQGLVGPGHLGRVSLAPLRQALGALPALTAQPPGARARHVVSADLSGGAAGGADGEGGGGGVGAARVLRSPQRLTRRRAVLPHH